MCVQLITVAFSISISIATAAVADDELLSRGEYILRIGGCVHCHTAEDGEELAGGRPLATPFGTFYTPNISPHPTAGIGSWSESEFQRALHLGVAPDGSSYYPSFPYTSYTRIGSEDARALWAYLRSVPASSQGNRQHELPWYMRYRMVATIWQYLFFSVGEYRERPQQTVSWNRGAYIAQALAHCGECHTPRNIFGATQADLAFAGNEFGPDDEKVPNITPHPKTGIGDWTREDLRNLLKFGELPDGEYVAGSMEPVVEGLAHLTPDDREALIDYLQSLPPVNNVVDDD